MKKRRHRVKPVRNGDGDLVTPVTGLPAAPRNWAPVCPSCQTRTCKDCDRESPAALPTCKFCGGEVGERHRCCHTKSTGTVESSVGTRQKCKCLVCGHSWAWTVAPKK